MSLTSTTETADETETDKLLQARAALQERIGYQFSNYAHLDRALTHPSSTAEEDKDNERMEFLGDAVVNLCVGEALYQRFPKWTEGDLTQVKSAVVSTHSLARAGKSLGLRAASHLGNGLPSNQPLPPSVYANLFEALTAAVYLDGGMAVAQKFIRKILSDEIEKATDQGQELNHKSVLQQLAQKCEGVTPNYQVVSSTGPDHGKIFEICAEINSRIFPTAKGRSKKEAQQNAARAALEILAAEEIVLQKTPCNGNGKTKNGSRTQILKKKKKSNRKTGIISGKLLNQVNGKTNTNEEAEDREL